MRGSTGAEAVAEPIDAVARWERKFVSFDLGVRDTEALIRGLI